MKPYIFGSVLKRNGRHDGQTTTDTQHDAYEADQPRERHFANRYLNRIYTLDAYPQQENTNQSTQHLHCINGVDTERMFTKLTHLMSQNQHI